MRLAILSQSPANLVDSLVGFPSWLPGCVLVGAWLLPGRFQAGGKVSPSSFQAGFKVVSGRGAEDSLGLARFLSCFQRLAQGLAICLARV